MLPLSHVSSPPPVWLRKAKQWVLSWVPYLCLQLAFLTLIEKGAEVA